MNFENIFILPNVIGDRSRRRFGGIFIKIPKVTSAWSSLVQSLHPTRLGVFKPAFFKSSQVKSGQIWTSQASSQVKSSNVFKSSLKSSHELENLVKSSLKLSHRLRIFGQVKPQVKSQAHKFEQVKSSVKSSRARIWSSHQVKSSSQAA